MIILTGLSGMIMTHNGGYLLTNRDWFDQSRAEWRGKTENPDNNRLPDFFEPPNPKIYALTIT